VGSINDTLKKGLRGLFEIGQRFGINILPKHFYSSTPDIRALRRDDFWRKPLDMVGVAGADLAGQITFLEDLCPPAQSKQWAALDVHATATKENGQGGGYGVIEAEFLHAFICRHLPRRIVQVGCGVSTSVTLRAARISGYEPEVICVEPYPSPFLLTAHNEGRIRLASERAEIVDRDILTVLDSGDMLFIDSTHAVKPGSEVNRLILDVLPRLKSGVFVHFHDIYFPYDYQRTLLSSELFFDVESTLLHAFLIGNLRCRIVLSTSMLHYAAPDRIARLFPRYVPQNNANGLIAEGGEHFPSATYLLTT
jgi:hypothetical protein